MPGKFDKVMLYAVNLVIFSIVVLKNTKQPPQLITKKYQLFLLNNTNHCGYTVCKIFPFCMISHCSKQQQAAKVNGKQCDQYKARKSASMPEKKVTPKQL